MDLTADNYYGKEADMEYLSVSQYRVFQGTPTRHGCEARGLAEAKHEIPHKTSMAMMIGSFVDAYFSDEFEQYIKEHHKEVIAQSGKNKDNLKVAYQNAVVMINRARKDPLWMEYAQGEKQKILVGEIGGVMWKIRMDVFHPDRTVDIKTCRTLDTFKKGVLERSIEGEWIPFIYGLNYDLQAAVYQEVRAQNECGVKKPFYLNCISKDTDPLDNSFHPMVATVEIPQNVMDDRLREVEQHAKKLKMIKDGEIEPIYCRHCSYCHDVLPNDHIWTMDEFYMLED